MRQGIEQLLAPTANISMPDGGAPADNIVERFYHHPSVTALMQNGKHPSYIAARTFANVIMDLVTPHAAGPITFEDLENGIKNDIPAGSLRTSLLAALQSADRNIGAAQRAIEAWYDDGMDRVTGWYKRRTQTWTLVVAAIVTITINADTLHIEKRLWLEPAMRAEFLEAAKNPPASTASVSAKGSSEGGNARALASGSGNISDQAAKTLGLVLGWQDVGNLSDAKSWFERVVGWLLTIFAVSLGAPFWFDVLNRFMNLRAAGKSPSERGRPPEKPRMPMVNP